MIRILIAANEEKITYNDFNQALASKKIVNKNIEEVKGTLLEAGEDYHIGFPVTGDLSIRGKLAMDFLYVAKRFNIQAKKQNKHEIG